MPFDATRDHLIDIRHNVELASQFVAGLSRQQFEEDFKTVYAVTRCLEIISEASRRLPDKMKQRHPEIVWRDIAGAGNVYRHDYGKVSSTQILETVRDYLPALRRMVETELDQP